MPTEIQKITITKFGGPENVKLVSDTLADPAPSDVQVQILHAGVSTTDINMRLGRYPFQKAAPLTPGYCLVGRIHLLGKSCTTYNIGDLVCAMTVYDSQATFANIPEKYIVPIRSTLQHKLDDVTALIVDWTTAYGMVYRAAEVKQGDKVFVHGMSGAVGWALFQLCKLQGAEVYGTASTRNHEEIRRCGGIPFDYREKAWIEELKKLGGVQAVFDPLGFESFDESYSVLNSGKSVLVGYGGNMATLTGGESRSVVWPTIKLLSKNVNPFCGKSTKFFYIDKDQKTFIPELRSLLDLLEEGKIEVRIKKVLSGLDTIPEVHEQWNKIEGMGSVTVKIA